jgi:hypothetical protein
VEIILAIRGSIVLRLLTLRRTGLALHAVPSMDLMLLQLVVLLEV